MQAKEEESSVQIAELAAELKRTQWEKSIVEKQAETLKTALAVWTGPSSQVCFMILFTHSNTPALNFSLTHSATQPLTHPPTHSFAEAFVSLLIHTPSLNSSFIQYVSS